jgi:hypothetical protein
MWFWKGTPNPPLVLLAQVVSPNVSDRTVAVFATTSGTGAQGQAGMGVYGVGLLLVTQALYRIANFAE